MPGTVVQDIEVRGSINIKADDVIVRRVRVRGRVWTQHSGRQYRVVVEDSVLGDTTDAASRLTSDGTIGPWTITGNRIVPGSHGPALATNTQRGASTMRWSGNARATSTRTTT